MGQKSSKITIMIHDSKYEGFGIAMQIGMKLFYSLLHEAQFIN